MKNLVLILTLIFSSLSFGFILNQKRTVHKTNSDVRNYYSTIRDKIALVQKETLPRRKQVNFKKYDKYTLNIYELYNKALVEKEEAIAIVANLEEAIMKRKNKGCDSAECRHELRVLGVALQELSIVSNALKTYVKALDLATGVTMPKLVNQVKDANSTFKKEQRNSL